MPASDMRGGGQTNYPDENSKLAAVADAADAKASECERLITKMPAKGGHDIVKNVLFGVAAGGRVALVLALSGLPPQRVRELASLLFLPGKSQ